MFSHHGFPGTEVTQATTPSPPWRPTVWSRSEWRWQSSRRDTSLNVRCWRSLLACAVPGAVQPCPGPTCGAVPQYGLTQQRLPLSHTAQGLSLCPAVCALFPGLRWAKGMLSVNEHPVPSRPLWGWIQPAQPQTGQKAGQRISTRTSASFSPWLHRDLPAKGWEVRDGEFLFPHILNWCYCTYPPLRWAVCSKMDLSAFRQSTATGNSIPSTLLFSLRLGSRFTPKTMPRRDPEAGTEALPLPPQMLVFPISVTLVNLTLFPWCGRAAAYTACSRHPARGRPLTMGLPNCSPQGPTWWVGPVRVPCLCSLTASWQPYTVGRGAEFHLMSHTPC